jgi:branched-chain amino acid transport system substrate-binding protein
MGVVVSQIMPFPVGTTVALVHEYCEALERGGSDALPNCSSMEACMAAKVFTEGLRRAGTMLKRDSLIHSLESLQRFDLGGFFVNFGPRERQGSSFVELSNCRIVELSNCRC